jgi:hypothetical protein
MLRLMITMLIIWALLIAFATSCATKPDYNGAVQYGPKCTTRIELRNGTEFEYPVDMDNLVRAEQGCVDHYGPNYCLVKFIKTGRQSYWAICGRSK